MVQFQTPLILKFNREVKITEKVIDDLIRQISLHPVIFPDLTERTEDDGLECVPIGSVLELGKFQGKDKQYGIVLNLELIEPVAEVIKKDISLLQGVFPYIICEIDMETHELKNPILRNLVLKIKKEK